MVRDLADVDVEPQHHRWSAQGFLRAWEVDAFDDARVEMVDGALWSVSVGAWHGRTAMRVARALPGDSVTLTCQSLVLATSVVDPDVWVRPLGAQPRSMASRRMAVWDPADVLLVVEVSDETLTADLTVKAPLYAAAGFATYRVVGRDAVHEHTDPTPFGYRTVRQHWPGDRLPVPYADQSLDVAALIGADTGTAAGA